MGEEHFEHKIIEMLNQGTIPLKKNMQVHPM